MLAERVEGRSREALLSSLLRDAPPAASTNSTDDGGDTKFLEPEEISARILKKLSRGAELPAEPHGFGATYLTYMRFTITAAGRGEIQTGNVEPIAIIFPTIKRPEGLPSTYTMVFGKGSGVGITEGTEENVPQ